MKQSLTHNELEALLNDPAATPLDKGWHIYRHLSTYMAHPLTSTEARTLLLTYMQLPLEHPSLLHSLMLGMALKMADVYPDFKLPAFLHLWDISNLRPEDMQRQQGADGKVHSSLMERLTRTTLRYQTKHPSEPIDPDVLSRMAPETERMGFLPIKPMVAIKMFESVKEGRKMRFVKLVGQEGEELSADWHLFHAKPWEIVGQMYSVLARRSAESGTLRADTIGPATQRVEEVFPQRIGFVEAYDESHRHYHVFDSESRHFVAEAPKVRPVVGGYVWFCPIVPAVDKFKSAIVLRRETAGAGRQAFGLTAAKVTHINTEKQYFAYQTADGSKGFANSGLLPALAAVGMEVDLIIYLRRGKDGEKRPHVAECLPR